MEIVPGSWTVQAKGKVEPRLGPMERARLPQAQGQSPRQEPGLCLVTGQSCAFLAAPSALGLPEGRAAG